MRIDVEKLPCGILALLVFRSRFICQSALAHSFRTFHFTHRDPSLHGHYSLHRYYGLVRLLRTLSRRRPPKFTIQLSRHARPRFRFGLARSNREPRLRGGYAFRPLELDGGILALCHKLLDLFALHLNSSWKIISRPAIRSHGRQAVRRMVEVRGVEPLSETASPEHLRVYPAFDLGWSTPTSGLIPIHPFGSAPCSTRAESPAAWPAKLCLGAQQTSALRHGGQF